MNVDLYVQFVLYVEVADSPSSGVPRSIGKFPGRKLVSEKLSILSENRS
jgi:hypothetical protein